MPRRAASSATHAIEHPHVDHPLGNLLLDKDGLAYFDNVVKCGLLPCVRRTSQNPGATVQLVADETASRDRADRTFTTPCSVSTNCSRHSFLLAVKEWLASMREHGQLTVQPDGTLTIIMYRHLDPKTNQVVTVKANLTLSVELRNFAETLDAIKPRMPKVHAVSAAS